MSTTPEQITTWKQEHGEIKSISVTVAPGDVATAYLKPANRNVVAFGVTKMASNKIVEAGEFVLQNCYIGGDERLKITGQAESPAQVAAAIAASSLLKMLEVEVKNA
ncbi:hypothetical protein Q5H93_21740 [Hymenobacter sp. ASUV-10]|uniref:Head decoration protein n=1 Tax=Hymenobacter aranciens TaxID=3063996 RepID=A0ABT9BGI9_9BACT|nr:hypothetical protein [Hymenobacter sp. ASUV-10]MDO7877379.1 hypothetical protein [Hymenobacter sp. ASUV-10]